jgi:myo-inositol-1(or 4)-monophosphatase
MDSCLAFLKVAQGELDALVIKMTTHREWDIAAPMAIIKEAGGVITDEKGQTIPCGLGSVPFSYLVASNGRLHQEILRLIAAQT